MSNLLFPIQYNDVFEGETPKLSELFKFFSRKELVDFAYIVTNNPLFRGGFIELCNHIFVSTGPYEAINLIKTKLGPSVYGKHSLAGIHTGIELFKQIFDLSPNYEAIKSSENEKEWTLFKILLIINEIITAPMKLTEIDPNDDLAISYASIITTMPCDDLINFNPQLLLAHAYKAQQLLLFCKQHKDLCPLVEEFCKIHSCSNINEYIYFISNVFLQIFDNNKNGYCCLKTHGEDESFNVFIREKFKNLTIQLDEVIPLTNNVDYKAFRAKPIIEIAEGCYYIIAPTFLINAIFNRIKFSIEELAREHTLKANVNQIITTEFTEQRLLYALLKGSIYPKAKHFSGKYCENLKISSPPDYYIRNGNDVYLFELKDYRLLATLRENPQKKDISKYIDSRLVEKKNNNNGDIDYGAIQQIVNNIVRVCHSQFKADQFANKTKNIYPILVFGESSFVVPGMAKLLDNAMEKELSKHNMPAKINIHSLLLLDIDSLIFLYNALALKKVDFKTLIKKYNNFMKGKSKPKDILEILMRLTISFSYYIKTYQTKLIEYFNPTKINL